MRKTSRVEVRGREHFTKAQMSANAKNKSDTQTQIIPCPVTKRSLPTVPQGLTPSSQRAKGLSCSSSGKDPLSSKAWTTTKKAEEI